MESISFSEFMNHALYDPEAGYYSRSPKIGKKGDFFTSVSVGSSFGQIIAYQALEAWIALGYPEPFHLIEQGAHDGLLMVDIMEELKLLEWDCYHAVQLTVIEPLERLRVIQSERLKGFGVPFRHFSSWEEVDSDSLNGFFYSNELIDSFPVDLVTFHQGGWYEKRVIRGKGLEGNQWDLKKITENDPLYRSVQSIPAIEGYTTEIHGKVEGWMKSVLRGLNSGVILIFDYGYPESVYYAPERTTGTLQMYRNHQKSVNPLINVGEQDMTAHVNFSTIYRAALCEGGEWIGYTDQGRYLTGMGEQWLCAISETHPADSAVFQKKIREFKTLTHPEMMGSQFKVIGLKKGGVEEKAWKGFRFGSTIPL